MGLDVYLYRCPDIELARSVEGEYERRCAEIWQDVTGGKDEARVTECEWAEYYQRIRQLERELGLDGSGRHPSREPIELDSKLHPDHLFKIGYFRSSYNYSGFDSVMSTHGFPTLYDIFDVEDDVVDVYPDWKASLDRVNEAITRLQDYILTPASKLAVVSVLTDLTSGRRSPVPTTPQEAMEVYQMAVQRMKSYKRATSSDGAFFLDGLTVHAVVPGQDSFEDRCVYIIYESEEGLEWYLAALEIVRETIEYVLAQPDPQNYYFHWSA